MPFPSVRECGRLHRMIQGGRAGGTSIEDLAEKYPEKIIKIPIDVFEGITDEQVSTERHRRCNCMNRIKIAHLGVCERWPMFKGSWP